MKQIIYLLLIVALPHYSCKEINRKAEVKKMLIEWIGKEVIFPADITCFYMDKDTVCPKLGLSPYRILIYADSTGCTGCKLLLYNWKHLIYEVDSLMSGMVDFLFYFQPKYKEALASMLLSDTFRHVVHVDTHDKLNSLNRFPSSMEYRCFLLDKDNRVLLVGNPTRNPKIWELYKEVITGKKAAPPEKQTTVEVKNTECAFGNVKVGESSYAVFRLKNTGEHPLIISRVATSCGCASAAWSRQPVAAGQIAEVKVEMKPEEAGFFSKTAEVHCNAANSPIRLTVSGTAGSK
jgi:hypothetical protein